MRNSKTKIGKISVLDTVKNHRGSLRESLSLQNLDVSETVTATGSRSCSLNRQNSETDLKSCCKFLVNMRNKSKVKDRNIFVRERQSRWDDSRRLQLCQNSEGSLRHYNNQSESTKINQFKDNEEGEFSNADFKTLLTIFLKRSSIYALNQVGNSSSRRRKIFWALIMIVGILGSGIQVVQYLKAYFSYPVVVNMDSKYSIDQEFPAITICNLNRIRNEFIPCLKETKSHQFCNSSIDVDDATVEWTMDASCDTFSNNMTADTFTRYKWQNLYLSLDDESRAHYGHQGADFIRSCSFNGERCSLNNFTHSIDMDYGNCYTFNAANDSTPALKTPFVGPNGGLELELNVETDKYCSFTKAVGARFQVHDPYHDPDIGQHGINVSPGFETSVALAKSIMIRLKEPYKDKCHDYPDGESMSTCNEKCFFKMITDRCKCGFNKNAEIRHCDLTRMSDICCIYSPVNNAKCDCPISCNDTTYEINIFSALYPSGAYLSANLMNNTIDGRVLTYDQFRETIVKLKVYYDTLETAVYQQNPMYQSSELFSQIGGQMGLWLGLSLVAIFECIENIVLLWRYRSKHRSQLIKTSVPALH